MCVSELDRCDWSQRPEVSGMYSDNDITLRDCIMTDSLAPEGDKLKLEQLVDNYHQSLSQCTNIHHIILCMHSYRHTTSTSNSKEHTHH